MATLYVDGRPKFYDPDIDWHAINQEERVSRLAAVPFFEEAGSLLQSAALLWPGRVRGQELAALGSELLVRGRDWRRMAIGWSDAALKVRHRNLPREEVPDAAGPVLGKYSDSRSHSIAYGTTAPKHEAAAKRLVGAALALLEIGIPIVGQTGQRHYRRKEAEGFEDRIEIFLEAPYARDAPKPSEAALRALKHRAVCRICDGLCHTAAQVFSFLSRSDEKEDKEASDLWYARQEAFCRRWKAEYGRFADLDATDPEERSALIAARDEASSYSPIDRHYENRAVRKRAGRVVECLVTILCRAAVEGFGADPPAEEASGELPEISPDRLLPPGT